MSSLSPMKNDAQKKALDQAQRLMHLITLRLRRAIKSGLLGNVKLTSRGAGFEFDQLREYVPGDDVRFIDWKALGRFQTVAVRQYHDDVSRTILIAVDVSASTFFSTQTALKADLIAQLALIVSLVGNYKHDAVGLVLFSDRIEAYVPPKMGMAHMRLLADTLFHHKVCGKKTEIRVLKDMIIAQRKKGVVLFVITDGIVSDVATVLQSMRRFCSVVVMRCLDQRETDLPVGGFVTSVDLESGSTILISMHKRSVQQVNRLLQMRLDEQSNLLSRAGIPHITVKSNGDNVRDVVRFLNNTVI